MQKCFTKYIYDFKKKLVHTYFSNFTMPKDFYFLVLPIAFAVAGVLRPVCM